MEAFAIKTPSGYLVFTAGTRESYLIIFLAHEKAVSPDGKILLDLFWAAVNQASSLKLFFK